MFCKMKPGSRFGIKLFRNHNLIFFSRELMKIRWVLGLQSRSTFTAFFLYIFYTFKKEALTLLNIYFITNILPTLCNLALQVTYFQTPNNWMQYNRIVKRGYSTLKHIQGTGQKNRKKGLLVIFLILVRLLNSLTFGISQESTEIKSLKYDITDVQ